jgi:hypothetical protein
MDYVSGMKDQKNKELDFTDFAQIEEYVKSHRAINHPLFQYLKSCSEEGFTPMQYQIYRENYFFRTFYTIPSIASLVAAAANNADIETLITAGENLYEELGSGNPNKIHSILMLSSHNFHGMRVFGLPSISIKKIPHLSFIIDEAKMFTKKEQELYTSSNYSVTLGAAVAHEMAANSMLINFYESFFLPYKNYYSCKEFYNLSEYFLVHICGLEENHAQNARLAAKKWATDKKNLNDIGCGSVDFLSIQEALWDGLYLKIENASVEGEKIPLRFFLGDMKSLTL